MVFSFNGEEWTYNAEENEDDSMGTGKVVTNGSRLNVRTGAGMNYEIIDQLRPGEEVVVVGVEGDWYQITVPEKNGYVHSDYLELIEKAEQNSWMMEGIGVGMLAGYWLGKVLGNAVLGLSLGVLFGMLLGSKIKKFK